MSERAPNHDSWKHKVILGQEAIVPHFGLGRVTSFGDEESCGNASGFAYIEVTPYAANKPKRFAPEAVSLIDPTGHILLPYKAREAPKKSTAGTRDPIDLVKSGPSKVQTRPWVNVRTGRVSAKHSND